MYLRQLSIECTTIVSPKASLILRNTKPEGNRNLSLQDICHEWNQQTPPFYSVLMRTAPPSHQNQQRRAKKNSISSSGKAKNSVKHCDWLPSVAVAGSILLKQRSCSMNAVLMLLIKYSGFQVCFIYLIGFS